MTYLGIGFHTRAGDSGPQHDPFKTLAAAEGDIDLPVREGGLGINDGSFKSQTLALVDGDGPGELEGILSERAQNLLVDSLRFFVQ